MATYNMKYGGATGNTITIKDFIELARDTNSIGILSRKNKKLYDEAVKKGLLQKNAQPRSITLSQAERAKTDEPTIPLPESAGYKFDKLSRDEETGKMTIGPRHPDFIKSLEADRRAGLGTYMSTDKEGGLYSLKPSSLRSDYTKKSTTGYIGKHKMTDGSGRMVTDLAVTGKLLHKGELVSYPLLVPTLTPDELKEVLKGNIPPSAGEKALAHARGRIERGLDPFHAKRLTQYMPLGLTGAVLNSSSNEGILSAIGYGFAQGLTTEIPALFGKALEFATPTFLKNKGINPGKVIADYADEKAVEWYGEHQYEGLAKIIHEGTKMFAPSIFPPIAGFTAGRLLLKLAAVSSFVGAARTANTSGRLLKYMRFSHKGFKGYPKSKAFKLLKTSGEIKDATAALRSVDRALLLYASTATASMFGASQGQRTEDEIYKRINELEAQGEYAEAEKVRRTLWYAPYSTAIIEATGELIGTRYLAKLFKVDINDILKGGGSLKFVQNWFKNLLKTMGVEVGTEVGQAGSQAAVEKYSDIRPAANVLYEMIEVVGPTIWMTLMTAGLGVHGQMREVRDKTLSREQAKIDMHNFQESINPHTFNTSKARTLIPRGTEKGDNNSITQIFHDPGTGNDIRLNTFSEKDGIKKARARIKKLKNMIAFSTTGTYSTPGGRNKARADIDNLESYVKGVEAHLGGLTYELMDDNTYDIIRTIKTPEEDMNELGTDEDVGIELARISILEASIKNDQNYINRTEKELKGGIFRRGREDKGYRVKIDKAKKNIDEVTKELEEARGRLEEARHREGPNDKTRSSTKKRSLVDRFLHRNNKPRVLIATGLKTKEDVKEHMSKYRAAAVEYYNRQVGRSRVAKTDAQVEALFKQTRAGTYLFKRLGMLGSEAVEIKSYIKRRIKKWEGVIKAAEETLKATQVKRAEAAGLKASIKKHRTLIRRWGIFLKKIEAYIKHIDTAIAKAREKKVGAPDDKDKEVQVTEGDQQELNDDAKNSLFGDNKPEGKISSDPKHPHRGWGWKKNSYASNFQMLNILPSGMLATMISELDQSVENNVLTKAERENGDAYNRLVFKVLGIPDNDVDQRIIGDYGSDNVGEAYKLRALDKKYRDELLEKVRGKDAVKEDDSGMAEFVGMDKDSTRYYYDPYPSTNPTVSLKETVEEVESDGNPTKIEAIEQVMKATMFGEYYTLKALEAAGEIKDVKGWHYYLKHVWSAHKKEVNNSLGFLGKLTGEVRKGTGAMYFRQLQTDLRVMQASNAFRESLNLGHVMAIIVPSVGTKRNEDGSPTARETAITNAFKRIDTPGKILEWRRGVGIRSGNTYLGRVLEFDMWLDRFISSIKDPDRLYEDYGIKLNGDDTINWGKSNMDRFKKVMSGFKHHLESPKGTKKGNMPNTVINKYTAIRKLINDKRYPGFSMDEVLQDLYPDRDRASVASNKVASRRLFTKAMDALNETIRDKRHRIKQLLDDAKNKTLSKEDAEIIRTEEAELTNLTKRRALNSVLPDSMGRIGEVLDMEMDDVKLGKRRLLFRFTKKEKSRYATLHGLLDSNTIRYQEEYLDSRESYINKYHPTRHDAAIANSYFISIDEKKNEIKLSSAANENQAKVYAWHNTPSTQSNNNRGRSYTYTEAKKDIIKFYKDVLSNMHEGFNITDYNMRPYGLRHLGAHLRLEAGHLPETVQTELGHEGPEIVANYLLSQKAEAENINRRIHMHNFANILQVSGSAKKFPNKINNDKEGLAKLEDASGVGNAIKDIKGNVWGFVANPGTFKIKGTAESIYDVRNMAFIWDGKKVQLYIPINETNPLVLDRKFDPNILEDYRLEETGVNVIINDQWEKFERALNTDTEGESKIPSSLDDKDYVGNIMKDISEGDDAPHVQRRKILGLINDSRDDILEEILKSFKKTNIEKPSNTVIEEIVIALNNKADALDVIMNEENTPSAKKWRTLSRDFNKLQKKVKQTKKRATEATIKRGKKGKGKEVELEDMSDILDREARLPKSSGGGLRVKSIQRQGIYTKEDADSAIEKGKAVDKALGIENIEYINKVDEHGEELRPLENEDDMLHLLAQGGYKNEEEVRRAIEEGETFEITGIYETNIEEGEGGAGVKQRGQKITLFHGANLETLLEEKIHAALHQGAIPAKEIAEGFELGDLFDEEFAAKALAKKLLAIMFKKAKNGKNITKADIQGLFAKIATGKLIEISGMNPTLRRFNVISTTLNDAGDRVSRINDNILRMGGDLAKASGIMGTKEFTEEISNLQIELREASRAKDWKKAKRLEREIYLYTGEKYTGMYRMLARLGERYWSFKKVLEFILPLSTITNRNWILGHRMLAEGIVGQANRLGKDINTVLDKIPAKDQIAIMNYIAGLEQGINKDQRPLLVSFEKHEERLRQIEKVEGEIVGLKEKISKAKKLYNRESLRKKLVEKNDELKGLGDKETAKKEFDRIHAELKKKFWEQDEVLLRDVKPKYHKLAKNIKNIQIQLGSMLLDRGIITGETYWRWYGRYTHYMYLRNMVGHNDEALAKLEKMDVKAVLDGGFLKQRENMSPEEQHAMGLVRDLAVVVPTGLATTLGYVAKHDYLSKLADPKIGVVFDPSRIKGVTWNKNLGSVIVEELSDEEFEIIVPAKKGEDYPEEYQGIIINKKDRTWTWSLDRLAWELSKQEAVVKMARKKKDFFKLDLTEKRLERLKKLYEPVKKALDARGETLTRNYTKMGTVGGKSYGALSGKFLAKPVADDIMPLKDIETWNDSQLWSTMVRFNEQTTMMFKAGKVALNPPTMFRNIVSNFLQNNLRGRPLPLVFSDYALAIKSYITKDRHFKEALDIGLFQGTLSTAEITEVSNKYEALSKKGKGLEGRWYTFLQWLSRSTKWYGKIDELAKLSIYRQLRTNGSLNRLGIGDGKPVGSIEAARIANKWGMDYSLASRSVKHLRRQFMPFVTYQYKVAPLILESLAARPWVMVKWMAFLGIGGMSLAQMMVKSWMDIDDEEWERLLRELPDFIRHNKTFIPLPWRSAQGKMMWFDGSYFMPWGTWGGVLRDMWEGEISMLYRQAGISNPLFAVLGALGSARRGKPLVDQFTQQEIYSNIDRTDQKMIKLLSWMHNIVTPGVFENIAFSLPGMPDYTERQGALGRSIAVIKGSIKGEPYLDKWYREYGREQFWRGLGFNAQIIERRQTYAIEAAMETDLWADFNKLARKPYYRKHRDKLRKAYELTRKKIEKLRSKDPGIFKRRRSQL